MIKNLIGDKAFYRKVLMLVLPIMLQNGLTNLVSMVDNIMVGMVGTEQMSAVAIVNQIIFVFNLAIFGMTSGIGIFTAQYFGKGDNEGIRTTLRMKLFSSAVILIIALIVFGFAGSPLINAYLHEGDTPMNLDLAFNEANKYLSIMMIGLIPFVISQVYGTTLREVEKPIVPMIASIIAVAVNLVFNALLIFGKCGFPRLGVSGAAIATVISRYVETIVVLVFAHVRKKEFPFIRGLYRGFKIKMAEIKHIAPTALPLLFNEFFWSLGMALLNNCYSLRGLDVVAATNITSTLSNLFNVSIIAFGSAISIIVGGLLGAGKPEEAKSTNIKLTFFSFMLCLFLSVVLVFISPLFPEIYNTESAVKAISASMIVCYSAYLPFHCLNNAFYFAMRSGGKTVITFLLDSGYMFAVTVPVTFIFAKFTSVPIIPLYAVSLGVDAAKCIIGFILIKNGGWAKTIVGDGKLQH